MIQCVYFANLSCFQKYNMAMFLLQCSANLAQNIYLQTSSLLLQGPYFPPPYEPLPDDVKFYYDGEVFIFSRKRAINFCKNTGSYGI